jgi:hypothetical protein
LSLELGEADAGHVIEERVRRPDAPHHVGHHLGRAGLQTSELAGLVDEGADALVARPLQPELVSLRADAPADLRDRQRSAGKPLDRVEQGRSESR